MQSSITPRTGLVFFYTARVRPNEFSVYSLNGVIIFNHVFFSFGNRCNDKRKVESPVQRKTISVLILVYFWKYNASLLAIFLQKKYMDLNNLITGVMRYVPYNDETTNVINFQCTKDNLLTICVGCYIVHRRECRIFTELCHHHDGVIKWN